jgi:hypothetical protein
MPTLLLINGFRFFFYSNENNEPVHIHIIKGDAQAKVWLEPVSIVYMNGFNSKEEKFIMQTIQLNLKQFKNKSYEYFN